jgi:predicted DNA-binding antitoxin AbrB/MazE fold protein
MAGTIRARVKGGMLEPLETLNLPEGKEVTVTILDVPSARDVDAFHRSAGGWKGTIDAEELIKNIYADRLISTRPEPRLSHIPHSVSCEQVHFF